jgi:hypothetical protein
MHLLTEAALAILAKHRDSVLATVPRLFSGTSSSAGD